MGTEQIAILIILIIIYPVNLNLPFMHLYVNISNVHVANLKLFIIIQGGPKVSLHTLGLIAPSCFILEGCCFADSILYLLVRGFRRQNLKIRIS